MRRRFAFVDIKPGLDTSSFKKHLEDAKIGDQLISELVRRITALNAEIVGDTTNLGAGFAIGHSFFCAKPLANEQDSDWYMRIIRTEILPLLNEYWFDNQTKVASWRDQLLAPM